MAAPRVVFKLRPAALPDQVPFIPRPSALFSNKGQSAGPAVRVRLGVGVAETVRLGVAVHRAHKVGVGVGLPQAERSRTVVVPAAKGASKVIHNSCRLESRLKNTSCPASKGTPFTSTAQGRAAMPLIFQVEYCRLAPEGRVKLASNSPETA
jgi:hypothetical protein